MRCVFLDRDGTICIDKHYNNKIKDLEMIGGKELIYNLYEIKNLGFYIIVITNQGSVSLGYSTEEDVINFNREINRRVGNLIDDFFFCPHTKDENCECRKPKTGLIELAVKKYNISTSLSWFIGDKSLDIETGKNIGAKTILVLTGHGKEEVKSSDPDLVAEDINQALRIIKNTAEKEITPICGESEGVKLKGVIDKKIKGKFSKLFKEIKIGERIETGFTIFPLLPVDFIIGEG